MECQAGSEAPAIKHKPKMFPAKPNENDSLTPWQRFENLASKVFSVPKNAIDAHKPIREANPKKA